MAFNSAYPVSSDSLATSAPHLRANYSYLETILNPTVCSEEHRACFVGEIRMFGGIASKIPRGWLVCNGSGYPRTGNDSYAGLYSIIGTAYGVGDGALTFNIPSFANVFVRGVVDSPGTTGGNDTHAHTLSLANLATHSHALGYYATAAAGSGNRITDQVAAGSEATSSEAGSGTAFSGDNVPKYGTVIYIIKR